MAQMYVSGTRAMNKVPKDIRKELDRADGRDSRSLSQHDRAPEQVRDRIVTMQREDETTLSFLLLFPSCLLSTAVPDVTTMFCRPNDEREGRRDGKRELYKLPRKPCVGRRLIDSGGGGALPVK